MFVEKRIENGFRCALAMFSGRIIYNFAFVALCGALQTLFSREGFGTNSLRQNLTVLPAPSGREPLARPQTLHFSRKLSRHAKGPIPEGAVAEGDWGSSGMNPFRLLTTFAATFPKGTALAVAIQFPALP